MKARREWNGISKALEKKNQPRIQYPLKMYFRNGVKIKSFSDKENLRDMHYKKKLELVLQAEVK